MYCIVQDSKIICSGFNCASDAHAERERLVLAGMPRTTVMKTFKAEQLGYIEPFAIVKNLKKLSTKQLLTLLVINVAFIACIAYPFGFVLTSILLSLIVWSLLKLHYTASGRLAIIVVAFFVFFGDTALICESEPYYTPGTEYTVLKVDTVSSKCNGDWLDFKLKVYEPLDASGPGWFWYLGSINSRESTFSRKDSVCAVRDSMRKAREEIRQANIAKAWRTVKTYPYANNEGYVVIQKNDSTGAYRDKNNGKNIAEFELKYAANNKHIPLTRDVSRDSVYVKFGDGTRKFVGIDADYVMITTLKEQNCRTKTTIAGKLIYTEYEACVRTVNVERNSFISSKTCNAKVPVTFWKDYGIGISVDDHNRTGCDLSYAGMR